MSKSPTNDLFDDVDPLDNNSNVGGGEEGGRTKTLSSSTNDLFDEPLDIEPPKIRSSSPNDLFKDEPLDSDDENQNQNQTKESSPPAKLLPPPSSNNNNDLFHDDDDDDEKAAGDPLDYRNSTRISPPTMEVFQKDEPAEETKGKADDVLSAGGSTQPKLFPTAPPAFSSPQQDDNSTISKQPQPMDTTIEPAKILSSPTSDSSQDEPIDIEPKIEIYMNQYEKRGDGMNAFIVYQVVTKIPGTVPGFSKKEYVVWRRFSDFLGLHEKLASKHSQNGRIVPPAPEKSVLGMTKTKMSKGVEEDSGAGEFLEKRRATLERYLRRTSQNPILLQDPDFREYLTLDGDLPKATNTAALSGKNVMRFLNKVGDTLSKITIKMDDNDSWFQDRDFEITELDEQLKKLHNALDCVVQYRKDLSTSTEHFCKSLSMLASCEENTSLSRALSLLVETQEKIASAQKDQSDKDFFIFAEVIKDYVGLIGAVKEVFYERTKVWQNWQTAQQTLVKKREVKTRFELAGKSDKLPAAKKEVQEWEAKVQEGEEQFGKMSKLIKKELKRFDAQRMRDFKQTLLSYLESLAHTQQQLVKCWEAFQPEAKAITV